MARFGSLNRAAQADYYNALALTKPKVKVLAPDPSVFPPPRSNHSSDAPTRNLAAIKAAAAAPKANLTARLTLLVWGIENAGRETTKPEGDRHAGSSRHPMDRDSHGMLSKVL